MSETVKLPYWVSLKGVSYPPGADLNWDDLSGIQRDVINHVTALQNDCISKAEPVVYKPPSAEIAKVVPPPPPPLPPSAPALPELPVAQPSIAPPEPVINVPVLTDVVTAPEVHALAPIAPEPLPPETKKRWGLFLSAITSLKSKKP